MKNFIKDITAELEKSAKNNYTDNYDNYRFGEIVAIKKTPSIKQRIVKNLIRYKQVLKKINNRNSPHYIKNFDFPISDFFYLYDLLKDTYSKELLVKIVAYRILGHTKVKLPLNTPALWDDLKRIEANQSKNDIIDIGPLNIKLPLTDLGFLGIPLKMYYFAYGINLDFIIKQYEYHHAGVHILAEEGDVVIDGGGCFGDTALYFANKVGIGGQVKVFEFIPNNIQILTKNLQLNPAIGSVVELVNKPLWNESNRHVFFKDNGPGSKVSLKIFKEHTGQTKTISIDDFVSSSGLEKVDFIKMDIEGAEPNALQGAIQTIKKFRPKLAIALYHSTKDFDSIPRVINDLNIGYKFYLSHSTIFDEETMLFATTEV